MSALAEASTADVIRLWSGLGYNRRAVWLQQAARRGLVEWQRLPAGVDHRLSLPGVGPYTARAVAAFAFAAQVAVVDTNVRRVLSRGCMEWRGDAEGASAAEMQKLADSLIPAGRAYEWNQALMEPGATVCTHYRPLCMYCPVQAHCRAYPAIVTVAPAARDDRAGEERPRWQSEPFVGSRRYYRGRIIHALRQLPRYRSIDIEALGRLVKPDFAAGDVPWLLELVRGLAGEGLAEVVEEAGNPPRVSLPQ